MNKKALLVVDMVKEYVYGKRPLIPIEKREELILNIKKVVELAHEKDIPVIYVNTTFLGNEPILKVIGKKYQAMKGSEGSKLIPELKVLEKDYIVEKRGYDGFWKSELERLLKELEIRDIYLAGCQTDCCVRETGVTAAHLGFNVYIIEDCCSSSRRLGHEAAIEFMRSCVGRVINSKDLDW